MTRLTVLAAALAAGTMTFAAFAQEAPVNSAAAFASSPATQSPAEPAPAPKMVQASDRGQAGIVLAAGQASDKAATQALPGVDRMTTASVAKPDASEADSRQPKKAGAKSKETRKAEPESRKEKKAEAEARPGKGSNLPTPQRRPELVANARKASVLADGGKSASTEGDKELLAETRKSGEKKVAALGTGGKYHEIVAKYASAYGVPVTLAHAVITIESNYRAGATGRAGEVGLMQIKPSTARMMGYTGSTKALYNPENNIKYGMKYLGKARELGGGTTCGTILKYNAGHGAKRMNPVSSAYCSKVKRHLGSA